LRKQTLRAGSPDADSQVVSESTVEHRDRLLVSFLGRYDVVRTPSITFGFGGGLSRVLEDERETQSSRSFRGVQDSRTLFSPWQSRSSVDNLKGWGKMIGIDISFPVTSRVAVVLPVRVTHTAIRYPWARSADDPDLVGHWNAYAGIGLALPVLSGAY
jgi:hypothetical protein